MFKRHTKALLNRFPVRIFYAACLLLVVASAYHLYFSNRIIPGVVLGGVEVGGLTYEQALTKTTERENSMDKKLTLKLENSKDFEIKAEDIELKYYRERGVLRAFEVGRTGNFLTDTKEKLAGLFKPLKINSEYTYDKDLLGARVAEIRSEVNIPSISAKIALTEKNSLDIVPEVYGKSLDEEDIYQVIRESFNTLSFGQKALQIENDNPEFTKSDLEQVLNETQKLTNRQIELKSGTKSYTLGPAEILKLVSFSKENNKTRVKIGKEEISKLEETIAADINRLPMGQVADVKDGRVTEFQIIQNGLEIDKEKFQSEIKQLLSNQNTSVMEIPLKEIKTSKDGSEYGIFALLGTGVSKFTGSGAGRVTNLSLAAKRTNGVLVPPGKEYSFNETVGEISGKTGYAQGYIISQGRTVLGEGGGVCQTSTTLFRAVLNAGLPITSRHPHAYRVGYYEQESPIGYDASVYQPSLDFKFVNDTSNYILIQSSTNILTNTLEFKIFGTPDGRKVKFSEAKLYNVSGPPAPLYQDDPTLPKGTVKQVDYEAPGGTAEFTRTVTRGDRVLFEDTYKSVYQPWRAIYLVGTK